jgi:glutamyl-tRNA synthetase
MSVRLRIAPSPTGLLHVGNARSAVFNWLYARHMDGTFIVRVDDTDRARSEQQYEDDLLAGFRWLGLDWDEGVEVGGPHGTYRQSDRFDRYAEVVDALLANGHAYHDFRSPDELESLRTRAQKEGKHPGSYIRRPEGSLDAARARLEAGERAVVRMAIPETAVVFDDLVRGRMEFAHAAVDDFVILRSDGSPTYHLASAVDDVDYEITHVARGEDLLSSTPKHIVLTEAIGAGRPTYAHLPLLFGPDGKKLSKRHGDTSLRSYREAGILADAMFNYMSLLGWSIDPENEVFTREEAIAAFELRDVSKSPAVFDPKKLTWMNGLYIRSMPVADFAVRAVAAVEADLGRDLSAEERATLESVTPLAQERVATLQEIAGAVRYVLLEDIEYDPQAWSKVMKGDAGRAVAAARAALEDLDVWSTSTIEEVLKAMLETEELSPRQGLQPLRVALSGSNVSLPLYESMEAVGKARTLQRLADAGTRLEAESAATEAEA